MMNDPRVFGQLLPPAGLCQSCRHARAIANDRGRQFLQCDRARLDPGYARYPALPVLACAGHEPADVR